MIHFKTMLFGAKKNLNIQKTKHGFSLIEILVSLGIISIVIVIFFNALLISITVTIRNTIRSNVREELSTIASLISKDIRGADVVDLDLCLGTTCTMVLQNNQYSWSLCGTQICKEDALGTVIFESNEKIVFDVFTFDQGFVDESTALKNNILITLVAHHENDNLGINNVIRQISTSTRNYEI